MKTFYTMMKHIIVVPEYIIVATEYLWCPMNYYRDDDIYFKGKLQITHYLQTVDGFINNDYNIDA